MDLTAQYETKDGTRPKVPGLDRSIGARYPLVAFSVLSGGAHKPTSQPLPDQARKRGRAFLKTVHIEPHGASPKVRARTEVQIARCLQGNLRIIERLEMTKPLHVDLVPDDMPLDELGYPECIAPMIGGVFWDDKSWDRAKIAVRQSCVLEDRSLVAYEVSLAVRYLAFTRPEQRQLQRVLSACSEEAAAQDVLFATFTEREFLVHMTQLEVEPEEMAPGVFALCQEVWNGRDVLRDFIHKLFFPYEAPKQPKLSTMNASAWDKNNDWRKYTGG